jgi:dTDP-4-dehydrorhamnose 3,5-epimerase
MPTSPAASPAQPSDRIAGVYVVPFRSFADPRGYFFETFRRTWVPGGREMIQGNCSFSHAGVLRGLHYHRKQADFWTVPLGLVRAALYDLRTSSPTRGAAQVLDLGPGEGTSRGLYIPKGVAHGFYALKDSFMTYLVDEYYDNSDELGVRFDDPALGLDWDLGAGPTPIVSERDQKNPPLAELPAAQLPP